VRVGAPPHRGLRALKSSLARGTVRLRRLHACQTRWPRQGCGSAALLRITRTHAKLVLGVLEVVRKRSAAASAQSVIEWAWLPLGAGKPTPLPTTAFAR